MPQALVIIPTYNEIENIEAIAVAVHQAAPKVDVLFVDDNSPDGTGQAADRLAAADPRIQVLHREGKLGLGTAYLAGFAHALSAGYPLVIEMDADFSHNPNYLPEMIGRAQDSADMVVGSRYVEGGGTENWGTVRKLVSKGGGLYARTVLGVPVRDLTAGFVCYRRNVLETLDLKSIRSEGYGFQIEMKYRVLKAGFRIEEMPIVFIDRRVGQSKMSGNIAFEALTMVWKLRFSR